MKTLKSKNIKKIIYGLLLSDGCLTTRNEKSRFDFYSKYPEYAQYVYETLSQITGMTVRFREKYHKRFNVTGYRIFTSNHRYLTKLYPYFYRDNNRIISEEILQRIDEESLANIWMGDGMLHFMMKPKLNNIQINGYICLERFTKQELERFCEVIDRKFGIQFRLNKCIWGKGWRVKISSNSLRKFISMIYPFVIPRFHYKCNLYYKTPSFLEGISNAEQFMTIYQNLSEIEDIIRTRRNS